MEIRMPKKCAFCLFNIDQLMRGFGYLEQYGYRYIIEQLQAMGVLPIKKTKRSIKIIGRYGRLIDALIDMLSARGNISNDVYSSKLSLAELRAHIQQDFPDLTSYLRLLTICIESYPTILSGKQTAIEVLFPKGSLHLVETVYTKNTLADYFNQLLASAVFKEVKKRLKQNDNASLINILEIGAGTGASTKFVLERLHRILKYIQLDYTDISPRFLQSGREKFSAVSEKIYFKLFDLEKNVESQKLIKQNYDIIYASNVLHATQNINKTLENIKILLKNGGVLIFNEATETHIFSTATFGLADGWWLTNDPENRLKNSPLLAEQTWHMLLKQQNWRQVHTISMLKEIQSLPFAQRIIQANYSY